jgi:hypothetical protein
MMLRVRVWLVVVLLGVVQVALEGHSGEVQRLAGRVWLKINWNVHIVVTVHFERASGDVRLLPSESGVMIRAEP